MADEFDWRNGYAQVRMKGLRRTLRALSNAGADAADMKDLMHRVGMVIVNATHPPRRSGRLAGSIRAGRGKTKAVVRAGGARVPYAGVRHYGWPARGIHPDPFLLQASIAKRDEAIQTLEDGLEDLLKNNGLT